MPEEENVIAQGERSIAVGGQATDNNIYSGDDLSIKIERDAISSAIISGNGNKVVIYQYQLERQVLSEKTSYSGEIGPNPYKGLLAFQSEDGDRYFGREEQIEKLWNLFRTLHENIIQPIAPLRLLPILGPSGSGKSSLARAGLIPELARRPLPGKSQARIALLVPGTHPVEALATVLARVATNDQTPVAKTQEFEQVLKATNINTTDLIIYDGLRRIANVLPDIAVSPLVVLVDQFEEVYSLCNDSTERQIFIENLIHAAGDRAGSVSVIITLRSDFLEETQRHPALNQVIASLGVIIPAMSEEELRRAITKPAYKAGHPLDEAVVSLLLNQTQGRSGALPLLQFALTRIWSGLKRGVEPVKTLKDIGGVGGALALEAQRIFDNLNYEEKKVARRVFLGLVQLGEGASDTRRRANVNSLVSYKDKPEYVKAVINRFASPGVRLVTLSSLDGKETAEVTHEALFDNWGQMKEWLDISRSDIRFQRRLDEAAIAWDENSRPEGSLWRSPDLDLLQKYHSRDGDNMTPLQVEFFNASVNAEEARKQAARKAEQERKRQRQALIGVLSTGFAITTATTLFAASQWQSAERGRIEQTAITAKNQLSTYPLNGLVTAISLVGQSRSLGLNFPNQSFPQSIKDSLFSAVEISREKNLLKGEGHQSPVESVAISTDGQTIISGGYDGTVRMWNRKGQPQGEPFKGHQGSVLSVAISADGQTIISGGNDGTVRMWNHKGQPQGEPFKGHQGYVSSVAISTDGQTIISGASDSTVRMWNRKGQPQGEPFKGHQGYVLSVAISTDGQTIISGASDSTVRMWDRIGRSQRELFKGDQGTVFSVAISTDSQTIISGGNDGTVRMWDRIGQPQGEPFKGHQRPVNSVVISADGQTIISGSNDGTVRIWDRKGQLQGEPFQGHQGYVNSVAISADGQTIISGGIDGTVRMWNRKGQLQGEPFQGHQGYVNSVAISADGQTIISGGIDGTVRMWNRKGQLQGEPFQGHQGRVSSVAISADGQTIISGGYDGTVRMWNRKGQLQDKPFQGHQGTVLSVAISADGQTIISGSDDGTVRMWNHKGQPQGEPFKGHQGHVNSVAISTDSQTIVSGGIDNTVRMWNRKGQPQGEPFKGHQRYVSSVAISTDGQTIISGGYDGTVRMWDIKFDTWLKAACERLTDHPVFTKPESADEKEAKATCQPYLR
ncbi:NACHT and WD repeat domain-containing protein [Nostoc parmelioides]|uniref:Novel STAND NTPase 1 domain-containing protein n=1 Tax=Nostoc parmelioides FACHB-3921 TaxID=2692909 RepID=A0ABR8BNQ1_9NOSO|nr:hypothetical protein [Nostoc parmelioides]MBD2255466.1 hypothetical protein [Nostoc parmelioides FACHB-3921]